MPNVQRTRRGYKGRCMMDRSPWSKVPVIPPAEMAEWLIWRDRSALQIRIEHIGEGYPSYRHPRKNIPEFKEFKVGSEDEMVRLLGDILDGKI
jgi:hypothetical protein